MTDAARNPAAARRMRLAWSETVPACVIVLFLVVAVFGQFLVPYDATFTDTGIRLRPPGSQLPDGSISWLGTDQLGRSVLEQVIAGARVSLLVGGVSVILAVLVGMLVGVLAGYSGGRVDGLLMRAADVQLAFPSIFLAIFFSAFFSPSILSVIAVLTITRWPAFARVARGVTLSVKKLEHVESARVIGASNWRILRTCIMPELIPSILVVATAEFGFLVIAEASLSFLGFGVPNSVASWGHTVADGRQYMATAWWISAMPGAVLALFVLNTSLLGDALRQRLDPKMQ